MQINAASNVTGVTVFQKVGASNRMITYQLSISPTFVFSLACVDTVSNCCDPFVEQQPASSRQQYCSSTAAMAKPDEPGKKAEKVLRRYVE